MYNRNLVSWIYLQVYFIRCFCITTVVYFMRCICMSPGMQHSVIQISQPYGLGLNETILPQYLQKLGYATHAVGKVSGVLVFVVHILHNDLNVERLTMSKGPEESWFCNSLNECHLILWKGNLGYLAFTLENRKFWLEKQKFCAIPFGKVQETWAVIWGDAVFLLFLVCSADLDLCFFIAGFSPTTSSFIVICLRKSFLPWWFVCTPGVGPFFCSVSYI